MFLLCGQACLGTDLGHGHFLVRALNPFSNETCLLFSCKQKDLLPKKHEQYKGDHSASGPAVPSANTLQTGWGTLSMASTEAPVWAVFGKSERL